MFSLFSEDCVVSLLQHTVTAPCVLAAGQQRSLFLPRLPSWHLAFIAGASSQLNFR